MLEAGGGDTDLLSVEEEWYISPLPRREIHDPETGIPVCRTTKPRAVRLMPMMVTPVLLFVMDRNSSLHFRSLREHGFGVGMLR